MSKFIISFEGRTVSKIDGDRIINRDGQNMIVDENEDTIAIVAKTDTVFKLPYND